MSTIYWCEKCNLRKNWYNRYCGNCGNKTKKIMDKPHCSSCGYETYEFLFCLWCGQAVTNRKFKLLNWVEGKLLGNPSG